MLSLRIPALDPIRPVLLFDDYPSTSAPQVSSLLRIQFARSTVLFLIPKSFQNGWKSGRRTLSTEKPLAARDLIKLNFSRNSDVDSKATDGTGSDGKGDFIDPVTFKVFTDNTHIVAIRHGTYANVLCF